MIDMTLKEKMRVVLASELNLDDDEFGVAQRLADVAETEITQAVSAERDKMAAMSKEYARNITENYVAQSEHDRVLSSLEDARATIDVVTAERDDAVRSRSFAAHVLDAREAAHHATLANLATEKARADEAEDLLGTERATYRAATDEVARLRAEVDQLRQATTTQNDPARALFQATGKDMGRVALNALTANRAAETKVLREALLAVSPRFREMVELYGEEGDDDLFQQLRAALATKGAND